MGLSENMMIVNLVVSSCGINGRGDLSVEMMHRFRDIRCFAMTLGALLRFVECRNMIYVKHINQNEHIAYCELSV